MVSCPFRSVLLATIHRFEIFRAGADASKIQISHRQSTRPRHAIHRLVIQLDDIQVPTLILAVRMILSAVPKATQYCNPPFDDTHTACAGPAQPQGPIGIDIRCCPACVCLYVSTCPAVGRCWAVCSSRSSSATSVTAPSAAPSESSESFLEGISPNLTPSKF
jgi:hypothetical protein